MLTKSQQNGHFTKHKRKAKGVGGDDMSGLFSEWIHLDTTPQHCCLLDKVLIHFLKKAASLTVVLQWTCMVDAPKMILKTVDMVTLSLA